MDDVCAPIELHYQPKGAQAKRPMMLSSTEYLLRAAVVRVVQYTHERRIVRHSIMRAFAGDRYAERDSLPSFALTPKAC